MFSCRVENGECADSWVGSFDVEWWPEDKSDCLRDCVACCDEAESQWAARMDGVLKSPLNLQATPGS